MKSLRKKGNIISLSDIFILVFLQTISLRILREQLHRYKVVIQLQSASEQAEKTQFDSWE